MKICDLRRGAGSMTGRRLAAPLGNAFSKGDTWDSLPKRGEGILESITRLEGDDTRLMLIMRRVQHTGILRWEGPPPARRAAAEDRRLACRREDGSPGAGRAITPRDCERYADAGDDPRTRPVGKGPSTSSTSGTSGFDGVEPPQRVCCSLLMA